MTRDEVKAIYLKVCDLYPSFKPKDPQTVFDIWVAHLKRYDAKDVEMALDDFIDNNPGGFAPNISNLIPRRTPGEFKGRRYSHEDFIEMEAAALAYLYDD